MNKLYVLNNSLDRTLFLKDSHSDTRKVNESKRFLTRSLAEKYINKRHLTERYSVKLVSKQLSLVNESLSSEDTNSVYKEISSAIDDTKDMIDTTLEYIEMYTNSDSSVNEDIFDGSNIDDVLDRLRKLKKGMSGICFRPSFYDSDGSYMESTINPSDDNSSEDSSDFGDGGDSSE